jgi:hypothetical protein
MFDHQTPAAFGSNAKGLPHTRLRAMGLWHSAATQLLNAGCRVTSIQKLLGHASLNTTMVYARVHDRTIAGDYYSAMALVGRRMTLAGWSVGVHAPLGDEELGMLFDYVDQLAHPDLGRAIRMEVAGRMKQILAILRGSGWDAAAAEALPTHTEAVGGARGWGEAESPALDQHASLPAEPSGEKG